MKAGDEASDPFRGQEKAQKVIERVDRLDRPIFSRPECPRGEDQNCVDQVLGGGIQAPIKGGGTAALRPFFRGRLIHVPGIKTKNKVNSQDGSSCEWMAS